MRVRTPRMLLRPIAPSDRREFVRLHEESEEAFRAFKPARGEHESWDDVFDFQVTSAMLGGVDGRRYTWVGELASGDLAGVFSLFDIFRGALHAGVASWYVDAALHHQGYGREAVQAMLDLAFARRPAGVGLHRIQANIRPENKASVALALRLGFRVEGVGRRYLFIDGDWRDHLFCAKLAEEHQGRWFVPDEEEP